MNRSYLTTDTLKTELKELDCEEINELKIFHGIWHNEIKIDFTVPCRFYFNISKLPSGCGMMVFHNYPWQEHNNQIKNASPEALEKLIKIIKHIFAINGANYLTTIGSSNIHRKEEKNITFRQFLERLGFTKISEYVNLQHSDGDYQELWIYYSNKQEK